MRDLAFEALAEVTDADWTANRGELNIALKSIRAQTDLQGDALVVDIREHAAAYRAVMPDVMLTPTALAKHWVRVSAEAKRIAKPRSYNQSVDKQCPTCDGHRFVLASLREPQTTSWMDQHGLEADKTQKIEEYAPCPECNPIVIQFAKRHDGFRVETPDPGTVKEMMRR